MLKVGIVGGTGYTGVELLRLLSGHESVSVEVITSRKEAGIRVDEMFPSLRGFFDLSFSEPDIEQLGGLDLVFFATPHGVAQEMMPELMKRHTRVVDLSADFRIRDVALWERWYRQKHLAPECIAEAVYGLPEVNRELIRGARLVAAAGCYPTSIQLGFLPLIKAGLVDLSTLIANAASGVSGAGKQASVANLLSELDGSFKAYAVAGHRHLPEIEQGLADISPDPAGLSLTFVPHLLPAVRGIHSTLYARLNDTKVGLQALYESSFQDEPFVDVLPQGSCPETRTVRGVNMCRIAVYRPQDADTVVILSVIDNLTKGAAGQAIQCMNIMFGLDEKAGLDQPALVP
ncbi:MAG: N-acetyl-gamma-glutamyl-phosphate reductase [Pseudomonadales bacterium]|nr:N-acetyl-gamma-glutamyl-phosphate reductase [Pseudomonadales bacterium]